MDKLLLINHCSQHLKLLHHLVSLTLPGLLLLISLSLGWAGGVELHVAHFFLYLEKLLLVFGYQVFQFFLVVGFHLLVLVIHFLELDTCLEVLLLELFEVFVFIGELGLLVGEILFCQLELLFHESVELLHLAYLLLLRTLGVALFHLLEI